MQDRAWKRGVAALALLVASSAAPSAWAFHAGATFEQPASAGGGEFNYYTGSPPEHGWKCDLCHQNPEGKISVQITSAPNLFSSASASYTPGATYKLTFKLVGEHLGFNSPMANYNSIAVEIVNDQGLPGGAIAAGDIGTTAQSTYISAGMKAGLDAWTFNWIAPGPTDGPDGGPPGKVTFFVAAVDGNAADGGPESVLTDPFGDDFFAINFPITQGGPKTADATPPRAPDLGGAGPAPRGRDDGEGPPLLASMLTLVAFGMVHRGRRRR